MDILIIEDEGLAVQKLMSTIAEIGTSFRVTGVTDSIETSVEWLNQHAMPDLILMDIELADGQSFEIFNRVEVKSPVIFTTSYDEYAIKAFKVNSIDYLLKPVKKEDLAASFQKLNQLKQLYAGNGLPLPDFKSLIKELQEQSRLKEYRERFLVKHGQRLISVETNDIAFFYTDEKVNFFKTKSNMKYIVEYTIDELETFVPPKKFFRINRQFLIAVHSIENIHNYFNGRLLLHLKPSIDKEVIISRERVNDFKDWMGK
jgi:two-component system response regulator LytT